MRLFVFRCAFALVLVLASAALAEAAAKNKSGGARPPPPEPSSSITGSLRVRGNPRAAERAALAHVTFDEATKIALTAVPGKVVAGELDVDNGYLIYDFVVVGEKDTLKEIEIDAGNGKVLDLDDAEEE